MMFSEEAGAEGNDVLNNLFPRCYEGLRFGDAKAAGMSYFLVSS
ncbi:hypothetical protein WG66_009186 [Moniliophthora roreri]|nr:hypothetical protein WG66_009186 [Moniliophthora roreri]